MSKFLKFIVNLFLTLAILTAVAILVPPLLGINTTIVDSAGMDTNLPLGSVTYSVDVPVTRLKAGDEILKENGSSTYAYIIEEGDAGTGKYKVSSAVDRESLSEITLRNTVSLVKVCIPYIGYVVVAMQTVEGIIIIVLVVLFIIILFVLSELRKSRDDDDDDDDTDNDNDNDDNTVQYEDIAEDVGENAAIQGDFSELPGSDEEADEDSELDFEEIPAQIDLFDDDEFADDGSFSSVSQSDGDASFYAESISEVPIEGNTDTSGTFRAEPEIGQTIDPNMNPSQNHEKFGTWNTTDFKFAMAVEKGITEESAEAEKAVEADTMEYANSGVYNQDIYEQPAYEEPVAVQPESAATPYVSDNTVSGASQEISAQAYDTGSEYEENPDIELEPNQFIAARRFSLEEILDQARKRGAEPKIKKDDVSGVSIVDYSDLIGK
jgi:Ca2+/Na+ antiporter